MGLMLDAMYVGFAAATAPWWLRKRRSGWRERFGGASTLPAPKRPRVLLHAVSVGEVGLIRGLVDALSADCDVVVSAMTDTGLARARSLYADRATVVRFPFDATFAVRRFLEAVQPDAVALVELEVWPNFVAACAAREIPVGVVNGRLSARSFARYRGVRPLLRPTFSRLAFVAAQDEQYAARFRALGAPQEDVRIAGSMKWDAARLGAADAALAQRAEALAQALGVDRDRAVVAGGSTAPSEHALLRDATPVKAQLICAPRRPEWFDDAARDLAPCARWSRQASRDSGSGGVDAPGAPSRFLLDVIGKLREAYALADVAVVGRSFGSLHGSDPMEPAALGKPVLIGPSVEDFADAVATLERAGGLIRTSREKLASDLRDLLASEAKRLEMGARARACVEEHSGATERCAEMIRAALPRRKETIR